MPPLSTVLFLTNESINGNELKKNHKESNPTVVAATSAVGSVNAHSPRSWTVRRCGWDILRTLTIKTCGDKTNQTG
jgi:hypothetical protein